MRNVDQLEARLMHGCLEFLVTPPVAVGLLDDDVAFQEQAFQYLLDVECFIFGIPYAESHILEIAEQSHVLSLGFCVHRSLVCCYVLALHWSVIQATRLTGFISKCRDRTDNPIIIR